MSLKTFEFLDLQNNLFKKYYSEVNNFFLDKHKEFPSFGLQRQIMIFYLGLVRFYNIDLIIESGVGLGFSTRYLIDFSDKFNVKTISIDLNKNDLYVKERNIHFKKNSMSSFVEGDGFLKVAELVKKNQNSRIALMLDGPKNLEAICLHYLSCFINNNVVFTFIDDIIVNSREHKSLKKSNFFYVYDLVNKELIFRNNKKKTLDSYINFKKKIKTEAELNLPIKLSNLFVKKEIIIWNKKKYSNILNLWFNPIFFLILIKLRLSSKIILLFLKIFRKINIISSNK